MQKAAFLFLFILFFDLAFGQESILNKYIQEGLESNLSLKQKEFSLQKSTLELREARGKFLPSIAIDARYSRAGGGRTIEFPVGEIVNPVYDAINSTRIATGQNPIPFPHLDNEIIPFLRKKEHETKIRAIQPLFQPALYYNHKLKSDLKNVSMFEVQIYKRELIVEIKRAYFNYLKSVQVVILYENTLGLLNENLRVSQKLFDNGIATKEVVYRAQAELSKIEQEFEEASENKTLAQSYFNHLLNKPLGQPIENLNIMSNLPSESLDIDALKNAALTNREELKQLEEYIEVASHTKGIAGSSYLPGVVVVADYGFQGEEYQFKKDDDYWMVSGILQWNLFNGFQDESKRQMAEIEKQKMLTTLHETESLICLQAQESYHNMKVAAKARITAENRLKAARESFKLINKKYEQGMAPHIEFIDARNAMTSAEVVNILSKYDFFIRSAEMERVAGLWKFEKK